MPEDDLQDDSQKTEEPTQRRLEEALNKGQVAFSREVSNFLILLALTIVIAWGAPWIMEEAKQRLFRYIEVADRYQLNLSTTSELMRDLLMDGAELLLIPFVLAMMAAFGSSLIQNGFFISHEPIIPKLEKISVLKGLKRLFSMRSVVEFVKGILKIVIVAVVAVAVLYPEFVRFEHLPGYELEDTLAFLMALTIRMLVGVCAVMLVIAAIDFIYQRFEYIKGMRMSKQELKEEHKQQEGDPQIKQKLRQIRMERAKNRMMTSVPEADVVITNPTHYSVALKYDQGSMAAPVMTAKGADFIALKMREIAKKK